MPLTMAKIGEQNNIKKITGKDEMRRHMENLGFVVGEPIMVVSENAGNIILSIKNSRIAIGRDMANRIMI